MTQLRYNKNWQKEWYLISKEEKDLDVGYISL